MNAPTQSWGKGASGSLRIGGARPPRTWETVSAGHGSPDPGNRLRRFLLRHRYRRWGVAPAGDTLQDEGHPLGADEREQEGSRADARGYGEVLAGGGHCGPGRRGEAEDSPDDLHTGTFRQRVHVRALDGRSPGILQIPGWGKHHMLPGRLDRQLRVEGGDQRALDHAGIGVVGGEDLLASWYVMA